MGERRGTKGLELWCRRMTEGYPGVEVNNMTTSWRDGLAFCAIIHHFRPDLIDFSKLNKDDIYYNNDLAFQLAERHFGIPALLEPEDMVEFPVPDRLSILTYLSQFYQAFVTTQASPSRIVPKRPANASDRSGVATPTSTSPSSKITKPSGSRYNREACGYCSLPVFIAERLTVGKKLFHSTCFRCARCNSQLTLANYYETKSPNKYCCETCPDEERIQQGTDALIERSVLSRSLSDEQKSAGLRNIDDSYSCMFETALEDGNVPGLLENYTLSRSDSIGLYKNARSQFIASQLDESEDDGEEDSPDLPTSEPPQLEEHSENTEHIISILDNEQYVSSIDASDSLVNVNVSVKVSDASDINQRETAIEQLEEIVTKDNRESCVTTSSSLVKSRMQLFENQPDKIIDPETKLTPSVPSRDDANSRLVHLDAATEIASDDSIISDSLETHLVGQNETMDAKPNESVVIVISDSSATETSSHSKTPPQGSSSIILLSSSNEESSSNKDTELKSEYPEDLNPFEEADDAVEERFIAKTKNSSLNPFDDDDDDDEESAPKPAVRKKIKVRPSEFEISGTDEYFEVMRRERLTLNPCQDQAENEEQRTRVKSQGAPRRKVVPAPRISLNPFWSDGEEPVEEDPDPASEGKSTPVPLPRNSRSAVATPEAKPRLLGATMGVFGSNTSLSSAHSSIGTSRKKKPAPPPPVTNEDSSSVASSPIHSVQHSPRLTSRKSKKAPLPPSSTPCHVTEARPAVDLQVSPIPKAEQPAEKVKCLLEPEDWDQEKIIKNEINKNRQTQSPTDPSSLAIPDKSTFGKWKRRKGPAPSLPIPQRRNIKPLPLMEIKRELDCIEIQKHGLEKQGVRLEQVIRDRWEGTDVDVDACVPPDVEEMILQLFELVNEKNELFRRQTELMYLKRQQRLEEEHADVEYQIRCLMLQPEANKTDSDKDREEKLISRLLEVVERRNKIVEHLDLDRIREAEEDLSISTHLSAYTPKWSAPSQPPSIKLTRKEKKDKKRRDRKVDADKDIDESESSSPIKDKKKKKKFGVF